VTKRQGSIRAVYFFLKLKVSYTIILLIQGWNTELAPHFKTLIVFKLKQTDF